MIRRHRLACCLAAVLLVLPFCISVSHAAAGGLVDTFCPPSQVAFVPCDYSPWPQDWQELKYRESYNFRGAVSSSSPLASVTITIQSEESVSTLYPYTKTVTFLRESGITSYDLGDAYQTVEQQSLMLMVETRLLARGKHTVSLSATVWGDDRVYPLTAGSFSLAEWYGFSLTPDKYASYQGLMSFFDGDTDKFTFSYRWTNGVFISVDPKWTEKYIVRSDMGYVHVDAYPYFQRAKEYIDSAWLRVSGTNGDSGVIPLSCLVDGYGGTRVSRFQRGGRVISHHTFGTCIDINAGLFPNQNRYARKQLIHDEVAECLTYNGLRFGDGTLYYDFTYSGAYAGRVFDVPETVVNYLLYELAFYRAGFNWGFYFSHTCDAMHFTLTESDYLCHTDPKTGLRKVFVYCN